jgi:hypothetical protein
MVKIKEVKTKPEPNLLDIIANETDVAQLEYRERQAQLAAMRHRIHLGWIAVDSITGRPHTGSSGASAKIYKSENLAKANIRNKRANYLYVEVFAEVPATAQFVNGAY